MTTATFIEYTGPDGTAHVTADHIDLLGSDAPTDQTTRRSYAESPVAGSGVAVSAERWLRVRLADFTTSVSTFRFWVPNAEALPTGWSLLWGSSSSYAEPSLAGSSVALLPVPTSDPGDAQPNCGGESSTGTGQALSDWIVLQAVVDTAVAGPGNALGFTSEGTPVPLTLSFAWNEA